MLVCALRPQACATYITRGQHGTPARLHEAAAVPARRTSAAATLAGAPILCGREAGAPTVGDPPPRAVVVRGLLCGREASRGGPPHARGSAAVDPADVTGDATTQTCARSPVGQFHGCAGHAPGACARRMPAACSTLAVMRNDQHEVTAPGQTLTARPQLRTNFKLQCARCAALRCPALTLVDGLRPKRVRRQSAPGSLRLVTQVTRQSEHRRGTLLKLVNVPASCVARW